MKAKMWLASIATVSVIGLGWLLHYRLKEPLHLRVHRLLRELAYQPSDLDFGWSGRPYDQADAEMKGLGSAVIPYLIDALRDDSWLIRREAVRRLRTFADPRVVPALLGSV